MKQKQKYEFKLNKNGLYILNGRSSAINSFRHDVESVSYTHLDVYKRQLCKQINVRCL